MTVALLGIGTELTRGDLTNTNGSWLAKELTELGFEVAAIHVVDDEPERIVSVLKQLSATHEVIISTGGLGPTTDDLTTECAAKALGVPLEPHEPSLVVLVERLARYGRSLTESNKKQAYFPRGATILPNDWGTAPGFMIRLGRAKAFFLPGVPSEMKALFEHRVREHLDPPDERTPHEVLLRTYGVFESRLNDQLAGIAEEHDVVVGYRVRFPEIDVKLHARDADETRAAARAEAAAEAVIRRLGSVVYGRGNVTLPGVLGERLLARDLRLGVAESCTGGLLASVITAEPGASRWFEGGIVAYANATKTNLLGVESNLIERHGAVSVEVAEAMASGARRALGCSLGIGITGIAGPEGGTAAKPVGTVCFGIVGPNGTHTESQIFPGDRQQVQRRAAFHALSLALEGLTPSERRAPLP